MGNKKSRYNKKLLDKKGEGIIKRIDIENKCYPIFTWGRESTMETKIVYNKAHSTKENNAHAYKVIVTSTDDPI